MLSARGRGMSLQAFNLSTKACLNIWLLNPKGFMDLLSVAEQVVPPISLAYWGINHSLLTLLAHA
jgi:hypothetical protein